MGDVVNLRMARKRKARDAAEKTAAENRVLHGRSKAERDAAGAMRERDIIAHEAHRRERRDDEA